MAVTDSFKTLSDQELVEKLDKPLPSAEFRVLQCKEKRMGGRGERDRIACLLFLFYIQLMINLFSIHSNTLFP